MGSDGTKPTTFFQLSLPQMNQHASISNGIRANLRFTNKFGIMGNTKMAEMVLEISGLAFIGLQIDRISFPFAEQINVMVETSVRFVIQLLKG